MIFALFSLKIKISEAALWGFVSQKINSFAEIDLDNLFYLFIYAFLAENYEWLIFMELLLRLNFV